MFHAIQAFDQQLYAISQQVKWSRPGIFEPHILRLDGFHSLSTFSRDLFEVVKCSTQVNKGHYMHTFKGMKYKCESPDSPALLNCKMVKAWYL
jgi:hypothetical protein